MLGAQAALRQLAQETCPKGRRLPQDPRAKPGTRAVGVIRETPPDKGGPQHEYSSLGLASAGPQGTARTHPAAHPDAGGGTAVMPLPASARPPDPDLAPCHKGHVTKEQCPTPATASPGPQAWERDQRAPATRDHAGRSPAGTGTICSNATQAHRSLISLHREVTVTPPRPSALGAGGIFPAVN